MKEIKQSDIPVLVDFWAEWCGPCKMLTPKLEEFSKIYEGMIKVVGIDVDKEVQLGKKFEIKGIPTVLFFYPDTTEPAYEVVGYNPRLIESTILNMLDAGDEFE